jgi:hypothetical protein
LRVVDISTPTAPSEVGHCVTPGNARGVAVAGDYAYVAADAAGLRVIDISTPSASTEVGSLGGSNFRRVAVAEDYAYVARFATLTVVDVSTPSAPTGVGSYDPPGDVYNVAVGGDYAYVATRYGLRVVDVSVPSAPGEVGAHLITDWWFGVAVEGNYAYVTGYENGLLVVDISTPSAPTVVGSYDTSGHGYGVAVKEDLVYVADLQGGFLILRTTKDVTPPQVVSTMPTSGAVDVEVATPLVVSFSEPINTSTLTYTVTPDPGGWVENWNSAGTVVTLHHAAFDSGTVYNVTVTAADDLVGNPLSGVPYSWDFTTRPYRIYVPLTTRNYQP